MTKSSNVSHPSHYQSDGVDVDGDACDVPRELADRIRKLAAKEDEQCH